VTTIATCCTPAQTDELRTIADMLDETGWRWIPSSETPNRFFPVHKCLLAKAGRRISIAKEGSAQCVFTMEVDGSPTVDLKISLPVPKGKCDAVHQAELREWASGVCRTVLVSPGETLEEATIRLTEVGHVLTSLADIRSELHPSFGLSWNPPTPWSSPSIGDSLRLKAIPPGIAAILSEKASCIRHFHSMGNPTTPLPAKHTISRLDLPLDFETRPSMARIMRLVADLGISDDDVRFPTEPDDAVEETS
jgi:hypothetical protein